MISLSKYSRRDLSNFLQIAQQADNSGYPFSCRIVEQVAEAHDRRLYRNPNLPGNGPPTDSSVGTNLPPCPGCLAAVWVTYRCGRQGWACWSNKIGLAIDGETVVGVCNLINNSENL